jgi:hypothetical protein
MRLGIPGDPTKQAAPVIIVGLSLLVLHPANSLYAFSTRRLILNSDGGIGYPDGSFVCQ